MSSQTNNSNPASHPKTSLTPNGETRPPHPHAERRPTGFSDAELVTAGLSRRGQGGRIFDLFRDRIVFPIQNRDGHTVAFTGRVWQPPAATDADPPKYLNTPDTPIYAKSRELFGAYEQQDRIGAGWPPVLVEGPTDTLAVWLSYARSGRTGLVALAPCGTAVTEAQLGAAVALPGARRFGIAVAFDGDQAGRKAADRTYELLHAHPEIIARGAVFAPGVDPAQLLREPDGRARLRTTLERRAQPLLHAVLDHRLERMVQRTPQLLHEIPGRLAVAHALAPLIAEQTPPAAVEALRHVTATVEQLTDGQAHAPVAVSETLRCMVLAVADYLETTPPRPLPDRSAPGPPNRRHPAADAFPVRLATDTVAKVLSSPISDTPSASAVRRRSR